MENWLFARLTFLVPLLLSLSVHEWAHAWTAWKLGDDTAERLGRLTLNPIAHMDPIGTLLLPLLGVPFGWAKPVPINPTRFAPSVNMRAGMMLTAVAGPLSNLFLAALCLAGVALTARLEAGAMSHFLEIAFLLNVILAVFNLLPIPPLDGSRVADSLMPRRFQPAWDGFAQLGPAALIAVIVLPQFLGVSLLAWPVEQAMGLVGAVRELAGS